MLREIKTANAGSKKSETAVEMLIACHDRIRNFTSVVKKLAHAEGSSDEEIRAAAGGAHRYFTVALPLHEADEEESLRPRLAMHATAEIDAALAAMGHQHEAIDEVIERLLPLLVLLGSNPAKLPEVHSELCSLSTTLGEIFDGHLQLEENVLFPAVAQTLDSTAQAALAQEMKERRRQG